MPRSKATLLGINDYINNLSPLGCPLSIKDTLQNTIIATITTSKKSGVSKTLVQRIEVLFYIIIPVFITTTLYSKKRYDFLLWSLGIYIKLHGLHYTDKGLLLLDNNYACINTKRDRLNTILPDINLIIDVLSMDPIFDINKTAIINNIEYSNSLKTGTKITVGIFVYDINKEYIGWYTSQAKAGLAFDIGHSTINSYKDTDKLVKGKYYFYSTRPTFHKDTN